MLAHGSSSGRWACRAARAPVGAVVAMPVVGARRVPFHMMLAPGRRPEVEPARRDS